MRVKRGAGRGASRPPDARGQSKANGGTATGVAVMASATTMASFERDNAEAAAAAIPL